MIMIPARQTNNGNIEKGLENSVDYVQMRCISQFF